MTLDLIPNAKPLIGEDEISAVTRVLRSGSLAQGSEVASFETEFAEHFTPGCSAVAVSSGTAGLHLGLLACGVGPGDEVIVPSFTFAGTANAVALTGAEPIFVDIEPNYYCLAPDAVEAALTSRTIGIMPVHLYGHPANLDAIHRIAGQHGLAVFEDAAQAHGSAYQNQPVGSISQFGLFSLYPTKNMTSGEGGIVTTNDSAIVQKLRLLRNQGMERRYENVVVGFNARMTDIHAAIGRVQLTRVDEWTATRQHNAAFFDTHLYGVQTPKVALGATHVYHQYTIRVPDERDAFAKALLDEYQVGSGVYYPIPSHRLQSFSRNIDLPESERAAAQVLSLPVHPSLRPEDLERVVTAVNALARAGA